VQTTKLIITVKKLYYEERLQCNVIKNCIMEPGIEATAWACELLYVYVYNG